MKSERTYRVGRGLVVLSFFIFFGLPSQARDTVYVSGGIEHNGLFPTRDVSADRTQARAPWAKIDHLSNSYLDLSVHYLRSDSNRCQFKGLHADTRLELMQWPLLGYEADFAGHGLGRLSLTADFAWGNLSVGDVYAQFGSGMILNLYEDRGLGIDNSLRGAKISAMPYKGISLTVLGGKQRRYWNCYDDHAWGWNYKQDAALGADLMLNIDEWSKRMRQSDVHVMIGGSWVSKYEQNDTILVPQGGQMYMYRLPRWIGAGDVRAEVQTHGVDMLVEYARVANNPTLENNYTYRPGQSLLLSLSYSRKGLSVLAQAKHSDNMSFRSSRRQRGMAGRLNLLPVFTPQQTYKLPALYPYATQYVQGEWAFQAELRYTWARKTPMGGKYGTTLKLSAAHVRGLKQTGSWAVDMTPAGSYYSDVNIELNKKLTKHWWLNAMLMYQSCNLTVVQGEGGMMRAGIAVLESKVQITPNVVLRNELQYLYSRDDAGQWISALCELNLWHQLTLSGEWEYNIGGTAAATREHYYSAMVTYTRDAHRLAIGYAKDSDGFNCAGGVCRYEPEQEGVKISYEYTW